MTIRLQLGTAFARGAVLVAMIVLCGMSAYLVLRDYVTEALSDDQIRFSGDASFVGFLVAPFRDDRTGLNPDVLAAAVRTFPDSSRMQMRMAQFKLYQVDDTWRESEAYAIRATQLSPHDYGTWMLLASIQQSREDFESAEQSIRRALRLAPADLDAHWQLGNVLLTQGKLNESLKHFRTAASGPPSYLQEALKLVWQESGGNTESVLAMTPANPQALLGLARFLLDQSQPLDSAAAFRQIGRDDVLRDPENGRYLDSLIADGYPDTAHDLWRELMTRTRDEQDGNLLWNGSFESDILLDFGQFDWSIRPSNYVRISIDTGTSHSGGRSLRIDFLGHETTRLGQEIRQLMLLHPSTTYRLRYFVKSEALDAPEGIAVTAAGFTSKPASIGSHDWEERTLDFKTSSRDVDISITQTPKFSYENPTYGTVWLDDFEVREIRTR